MCLYTILGRSKQKYPQTKTKITLPQNQKPKQKAKPKTKHPKNHKRKTLKNPNSQKTPSRRNVHIC